VELYKRKFKEVWDTDTILDSQIAYNGIWQAYYELLELIQEADDVDELRRLATLQAQHGSNIPEASNMGPTIHKKIAEFVLEILSNRKAE